MARNKRIIAFVSMVLGTTATGLVTGALVAFILSKLFNNSFGGWGGLVAVGIGMAVGYPLGIILGQMFVNSALHYPGCLLRGVVGALAGVLPLVAGQIWPSLLPAGGAAILLLVLCPLLGTIGYHLRKH